MLKNLWHFSKCFLNTDTWFEQMNADVIAAHQEAILLHERTVKQHRLMIQLYKNGNRTLLQLHQEASLAERLSEQAHAESVTAVVASLHKLRKPLSHH
jgi:hypothetical protein